MRDEGGLRLQKRALNTGRRGETEKLEIPTEYLPCLRQTSLVAGIDHEDDGVTLIIVLRPDRSDVPLTAKVEELHDGRGKIDLADCRIGSFQHVRAVASKWRIVMQWKWERIQLSFT